MVYHTPSIESILNVGFAYLQEWFQNFGYGRGGGYFKVMLVKKDRQNILCTCILSVSNHLFIL